LAAPNKQAIMDLNPGPLLLATKNFEKKVHGFGNLPAAVPVMWPEVPLPFSIMAYFICLLQPTQTLSGAL
jgi:hypothetical protein